MGLTKNVYSSELRTDDIKGSFSSGITLPVYFDYEEKIIALKFSITYDKDFFSPTSFTLVDETSTWVESHYIDSINGKLTIAMAGSNGISQSNLPFIRINFDVVSWKGFSGRNTSSLKKKLTFSDAQATAHNGISFAPSISDALFFIDSNKDSDGDTMTDAWEIEHGIDPISSHGINGRDGDIDDNNKTNYEEFLIDTRIIIPTTPTLGEWGVVVLGMLFLGMFYKKKQSDKLFFAMERIQ